MAQNKVLSIESCISLYVQLYDCIISLMACNYPTATFHWHPHHCPGYMFYKLIRTQTDRDKKKQEKKKLKQEKRDKKKAK